MTLTQATHGACVSVFVTRRAEGMACNDRTDATHPRRAFAWGCAGGLSAVPLLSAYFFNIIKNLSLLFLNCCIFVNFNKNTTECFLIYDFANFVFF
jgi:hypothetical protein